MVPPLALSTDERPGEPLSCHHCSPRNRCPPCHLLPAGAALFSSLTGVGQYTCAAMTDSNNTCAKGRGDDR
ncbi:hypothetical protein E2562_003206 [Oryza meyeriana var. granulata]|uniref:Uncharacterized protein n=1 Tax=Oryza meyeriana var. granulata TaxID=110450 RepID=A0A6G1EUR1_9ORYZ|nr:hypothetical protein E2562_003206 [Oryza meyeriana var. granulata]